MSLDSAIGILIVAGMMLAMCFGIAHEEGKKGHRFRGAFLACFVALAGYGLLYPPSVFIEAAAWIGAVSGVITAYTVKTGD